MMHIGEIQTHDVGLSMTGESDLWPYWSKNVEKCRYVMEDVVRVYII